VTNVGWKGGSISSIGTVTEWKQNCHLVLLILRSCVIIQDDNVIGRQDPLRVAAGLAWPACFERGRHDSDVSAQAASATLGRPPRLRARPDRGRDVTRQPAHRHDE
jgi:hypothetical protein